MSRASLLLAVAALASCAEEPTALQLIIATTAAVPDELDTVLVTITAENSAARFCQARTGLFHLGSAGDLPLVVRVERGETYTEAVAFRLVGVRGEGRVTAFREGLLGWPALGVHDVEVSLEAGCLLEALGEDCGPGEHCVDHGCEASPIPGGLDGLERLDEASCWRDD